MSQTKKEKPEECYGCGWATDQLEYFEYNLSRSREDQGMWLCDICKNTHLGNATEYPEQFKDERATMQTIVYCTHLILDALGLLQTK